MYLDAENDRLFSPRSDKIILFETLQRKKPLPPICRLDLSCLPAKARRVARQTPTARSFPAFTHERCPEKRRDWRTQNNTPHHTTERS
jgi:hypothetical protein